MTSTKNPGTAPRPNPRADDGTGRDPRPEKNEDNPNLVQHEHEDPNGPSIAQHRPTEEDTGGDRSKVTQVSGELPDVPTRDVEYPGVVRETEAGPTAEEFSEDTNRDGEPGNYGENDTFDSPDSPDSPDDGGAMSDRHTDQDLPKGKSRDR